MRIAIVVAAFPVLSETFISNKVKALAARGHSVRVFVGSYNKALYQQLFKGNLQVSLYHFSVKKMAFFVSRHPFGLAKAIKNKKKRKALYNQYRVHAINAFNPDIVHFEFSGIAADMAGELTNLKGKKIVSCRGSAEKIKLLLYKERKEQLRTVFGIADAIHCVSRDMQNFIEPYCSQPQKTFINHPSIDAQFFSRQMPYPPTEQPAVILSIGRLIFQKGYVNGLLAIRQLYRHHQQFKWHIIAAGPQYEELMYHIHQMQLSNIVHILPATQSAGIQAQLEKAQIFFLPSVSEGIANVVLEAMSMELPVVSTRCGGMAEVIEHGANGLLADVYDTEALAAHLLYCLQHVAEAREMGKKARITIKERFTLEQQTTVFENKYRQLTQLPSVVHI